MLAIKFCKTVLVLILPGFICLYISSANLTQTAWRKAEIGYDEIEVVTDVEKVINLHNRYFLPVWADLSEYGDAIAINTRLTIV